MDCCSGEKRMEGELCGADVAGGEQKRGACSEEGERRQEVEIQLRGRE